MKNKIYIIIGIVLSVSGLSLIFISETAFNKVDDLANAKTDLAPPKVQKPAEDLTPDLTIDSTENTKKVVVDTIAAFDSVELELKPVKETNSLSIENYLVVVGSFKNKENAKSLVSNLRAEAHEQAFIFSQENGFHYAVLNSFSSRSEAKKALTDSGIDGWVKKK